MDKQITIRMPKELLTKWLAALRSGEYRQCRKSMKSVENGAASYCCLGVLVEVSGEQNPEEFAGGLPTEAWIEQHGVEFDCADACEGNPRLPPLCTHAAGANDDGRTFAEIADAIEACAEGF